MHVVLIDALNLIRRIYAVRENMADCIRALEGSLQRLQQELEPTHALVIFDGGAKTWRHRLYPDYKQGRAPMPEELAEGLVELAERMQAWGWPPLSLEAVEADDLIATLALRLRRQQVSVSVISTDKVFAQLLPYGVRVRDHFNRSWLSVAAVRERYAVEPEYLADFWGLAGDSGNHIPGISGIGAKTAARLLQQYGSLEACLEAAPTIEGKLGEKLTQGWAQALLSRALVELRTDFDLGRSFNLSEFRRPRSA